MVPWHLLIISPFFYEGINPTIKPCMKAEQPRKIIKGNHDQMRWRNSLVHVY